MKPFEKEDDSAAEREETQGYSSEMQTKQTGRPSLLHTELHTVSLHRSHSTHLTTHLPTRPPFGAAC